MRDLRSTKFYAIFLVSVVLVGIFSISPASSSLTNYVIIGSTGQISTTPIAKFSWYTDFSTDVLEPIGGGYYDYTVTTWPFWNRVVLDEADYTAAIINDPTAIGGKSLYLTRPAGATTHCATVGKLNQIGFNPSPGGSLYMDVRMKLPSNYNLDVGDWHEIIVTCHEKNGDGVSFMHSVQYRRDAEGYCVQVQCRTNPPWTLIWVEKWYGELPLNQWFHLKTFHTVHSTQGIVKVWLNKKLIIDVSNKKTTNGWTYNNNRFGGLYGSGNPQTQFWIGTIYVSDVAP